MIATDKPNIYRESKGHKKKKKKKTSSQSFKTNERKKNR